MIRLFRVAVLLAVLLLIAFNSQANASIQSMTVDEILYQSPNSASTISNSGEVRMDVINDAGMWFLLVELTNTTTQNPFIKDAAGILTGVGFQLPAGFSISATKSSNTISPYLIDNTSPSLLIPSSDTAISSENWGFGNASSGHFDGTPNILAYNTVISTFNSDVTGTTLNGMVADGSSTGNIDQFDYGIKSANAEQGPGPKEPYYQDHLTFKVKLDTPVSFDVDTVLAAIDGGNIGLAFGSPDYSSLGTPPGGSIGTIPEPASIFVWSLLVGVAAITTSRPRK